MSGGDGTEELTPELDYLVLRESVLFFQFLASSPEFVGEPIGLG
jgi:hypothetical protein